MNRFGAAGCIFALLVADAWAQNGEVDPDRGVLLLDSDFDTGWSGWSTTTPAVPGDAGWIWHADPGVASGDQNGALWFTLVGPCNTPVYPGVIKTVRSPSFVLEGQGNLVSFDTLNLVSFDTSPDSAYTVFCVVQLEVEGDPTPKLLTAVDSSWFASPGEIKRVWVGLDSYASTKPKPVRLRFDVWLDVALVEPTMIDWGMDLLKKGWVIDRVKITRQDVPIQHWGLLPAQGKNVAMASIHDRLYFATIEKEGTLKVRSTDTSGKFESAVVLTTENSKLGSVVLTAFDANLPPLLAGDPQGQNLWLFAVSSDGRLCRWQLADFVDAPWTWQNAMILTSAGVVKGRPTVVVTSDPALGGWGKRCRVFFKYQPAGSLYTYVRYMNVGSGAVMEDQPKWKVCAASAVQPTAALQPDGVHFAVVYPESGTQKLKLYQGEGLNTTIWSYKNTSKYTAGASPSLVWFRDGWLCHFSQLAGTGNFHQFYSGAQGTSNTSVLTPNPAQPGTETSTTITGEPRAIVYHGELLVVCRSGDKLRCFRKGKGKGVLSPSYAESTGIGSSGLHPIVQAGGAPALALHGEELYIASQASAVTLNGLTATLINDPTFFLCMSRSLFRDRLGKIGLPALEPSTPGGSPLDIAPDRLTVTTRLGKATWDFPAWIDTFFSAGIAKLDKPFHLFLRCYAGSVESTVNAWTGESETGIHPDATLEAIQSALLTWVYQWSIATGQVPVWSAESLAALQFLFPDAQWKSPFGTAPDGRPIGFASTAAMAGGMENWKETVRRFVYDGEGLRMDVKEDLQFGVTLLQLKYDWVKNSMYGTEFTGQAIPFSGVKFW